MHAGHRQRMLEKLKTSDKSLSDHELLEIFLYNAFPRIDTNPIAHALIGAFGSLEGVLGASMDELLQIENVGQACAAYILVCAKVLQRMKVRANPNPSLKCFADFKNYLKERFKNAKNEDFLVYFLNKRYKIINEWKCSDFNENSVKLNLKELSTLIGLNKPYSVVVSHNHLSGNAQPTSSDDTATASIALLLSVSGVQFYDHIIIADEKVFSYHLDGRLKEICSRFNIQNITQNLEGGNLNIE